MNQLPSRSLLIELVKNTVEESRLQDAVVYVFKELLQPGNTYTFSRQVVSVEKFSVLLFVDLVPKANWSHDCLYILYDENETREIKGGFPPAGENLFLLMKPGGVEDWVLLSQEEKK